MSSVQMMFGVNLFSCIFTACSLLEQGGFTEAVRFMLKHWDFGLHAAFLSVSQQRSAFFILAVAHFVQLQIYS